MLYFDEDFNLTKVPPKLQAKKSNDSDILERTVLPSQYTIKDLSRKNTDIKGILSKIWPSKFKSPETFEQKI